VPAACARAQAPARIPEARNDGRTGPGDAIPRMTAGIRRHRIIITTAAPTSSRTGLTGPMPGKSTNALLQSTRLAGRTLSVAWPFPTARFAVDAETGRFTWCSVKFASD
jgi:hypothetical protein